MFSTIARFELRYQMRNPVFWVATILFFLLTFGATTVESIRLGSGGNIHTNAPTAIVQINMIMSIFFMFVTTAFVGNVVVRDDETGFGGIIRSTKINKNAYMYGRFAGAFLGAAVAFLAVPLAIWIGTFMPWVSPDNLGPNRLQDYMFAYFVLALPNLLITSAIFFAVACWTRSVTYSYLTVILLMFAYFALTAMLRKWPDLTIASSFEPFGAIAFGLDTRYLSPIQANTQSLQLTGALLGNRILWLALSAAIVSFAVWRFRFATRGVSMRGAQRQAVREQKLAAVTPVIVRQLPETVAARAGWHQLATRTLFEMKLLFKSPAFWVLAIVSSISLFSTLSLTGVYYGIPIWPRTFAIVDAVRSNSSLITMLMAIYFSGEVVWRERERRINEIVDATPLPNWVFLVSKLASVAGVLIALSVIVVLIESVLFQLMRGMTDIRLDQWLAWFVAPGIVYVIQLSVLAIVVQALSPNKFLGWAIMLVYLVSTIVFAGMGLDHPLVTYAEVKMPLSDMNGADYGGVVGWWLRLYWMAFAVALAIVGHLMWRRGTAVTVKGQWRTLPMRLRGKPLGFFLTAIAVTAGLGGFLFYNFNILNRYIGEDEFNKDLAEYEKQYSRYVDLPQPKLTDIKLKVDLYPARHKMFVDGNFGFVNDKSVPIPTLHVRTVTGFKLSLRDVVVPGAKLIHEDKDREYLIFRFDRPLQPGESGTLSFKTSVDRHGLTPLPSSTQAYEVDAQPARNGTYVTNYQLVPVIGMNRRGFLQGNNLRKKFGLPAEETMPKLQDRWAQAKNYVGMERVNTDITVTTDADQTPVAVGKRVSDTVVNGRRTARFVSPIPSFDFMIIQSARYAVKSKEADGVKLEVYYHPAHPKNVDRMLDVMKDALAYYKKNFGPYQYQYARVIERPGYGGGANSAAGTIGYNERIGFIMDLSDPKRLDFLSYVTSHELAHQYWFHQLMPANMQGAELLTEGLAQYSALMVMKHRYGNDQIRQFLKYELDIYLQGRRMETGKEYPLALTTHQGYIHYNKASLVMYLLQDRLGEDRVNALLRGLLARYKFKGAPYARSADLVDGLLSLARTSEERELVNDLFYRITLYDLQAKQATVRKLPNGQYETTILVNAGKVYSDEKGTERTAKLNDPVDIGLFTARPGDGGFDHANVLSLKRFPLHSGEQKIKIVTAEKPLYAGVDPYITFIDRDTNDNVVQVTDAVK